MAVECTINVGFHSNFGRFRQGGHSKTLLRLAIINGFRSTQPTTCQYRSDFRILMRGNRSFWYSTWGRAMLGVSSISVAGMRLVGGACLAQPRIINRVTVSRDNRAMELPPCLAFIVSCPGSLLQHLLLVVGVNPDRAENHDLANSCIRSVSK